MPKACFCAPPAFKCPVCAEMTVADLRAILKAVRELHCPVTVMGQVLCDECSTQRSTGPNTSERIAFIPHPCRTIQTLNGEAS